MGCFLLMPRRGKASNVACSSSALKFSRRNRDLKIVHVMAASTPSLTRNFCFTVDFTSYKSLQLSNSAFFGTT